MNTITAEQAAELRKQINKTAAEKRQRLQKAVDLCKRINNIIDLDVEVGGAAWRELIRLRDDILREAGASENDIVQISHRIFLHGEPYNGIL